MKSDSAYLRKVLLLPDVQGEYVDKKAWSCALNFARSKDWDDVVQLGDFLDCESISRYVKGKPRVIESKRLAKEYAFCGRLLDELREAVGSAQITILQGNHELRVQNYLDEHPELEGLLEVERGLQLDERGINYVKCYPNGDLLKLGKLYVTHGIYCGAHHAKAHVDHFGVNIVYGHTHTVQKHTKKIHGKNKNLMGLSLGCLCKLDLPYLNGAPNSWAHAFGTVYIEPNGTFYLSEHTIINGRVVVDGEWFSWHDAH